MIMKAFDIGLSALRTHQQALATMGHNIANASTPGYHRQRVELVNRPPSTSDPLQIGTGVDVKRISRLRDTAVETALLRNSSVSGYASQALDIASQMELFLTPSDTSIHSSLSSFFNRLEHVANAPHELSVRREFLASAQELMQGFGQLDQSLAKLDSDVRSTLKDGVLQVNQLIRDIADLNAQIFQARSMQREPNDLLDRRDQLVTELSGFLDAEILITDDGNEHVVLASGALVIGQRAVQIEFAQQNDGSYGIRRAGADSFLPVVTGKFRALLEATNELIPEQRLQINALASQLVRTLDQQHARGLTDSGPYEVMTGQRSVADVHTPLQEQGLAFPIVSGNLYITVTNKSTGNRTTEMIQISPAVDSLSSLALQIDGLAGVSATIDPARGTMTIHAESGFEFDFAGRPDNVPDLTSFSGTGVPMFSGNYTGNGNDEWNVTFSGPGTIGLTPGLTAVITDQAGQIIASHNVGAGYEAGQPLLIRDGMTLQMASGSVLAADEFSLFVIADSDETGVLSALGINSLFEGTEVGTFQVRSQILQNPQYLAGSMTGTPGDATNFAELSLIRDLRFQAIGNRTITEELAEMTADSGLSVQSAESQLRQSEFLQQRLSADRDSVSGVDINEEMLRMLEVERAFQAASRFISAVNSTLDELFRLVQ